MIWECGCGLCGTSKYYFVSKGYSCPCCNSLLSPREEFSLVFWDKHGNVYDENVELHPSQKAVLEAIKVIQPCSDKMIALYLNKPINKITNRRGELFNASIPYILRYGEKILDKDSNKYVYAWIINKSLEDFEKQLERKCLV